MKSQVMREDGFSQAAYSEERSIMRILVTGGIVNLIMAFLLVNLYGIYGTAIACVLTEALLLLLAIYFFKKTTKNE